MSTSQHPQSQTNQSGFTIIESLVAIIVVTILMIGLAPVLTLAVATRVQARRVERATQVARAYIDGVRAGTIVIPNNTVAVANAADKTGFGGVSAPNSGVSLSCPSSGNGYCQNGTTPGTTLSLYCFDFDGSGCSTNSPADMILQAYRSVPSATAESPEKTYFLAVRVYRADAFSSGKTRSAGTQKATFTGGTGSSSIEAPLVEMTTEISDSKPEYKRFCDRLGGCN